MFNILHILVESYNIQRQVKILFMFSFLWKLWLAFFGIFFKYFSLFKTDAWNLYSKIYALYGEERCFHVNIFPNFSLELYCLWNTCNIPRKQFPVFTDIVGFTVLALCHCSFLWMKVLEGQTIGGKTITAKKKKKAEIKFEQYHHVFMMQPKKHHRYNFFRVIKDFIFW